MKIGVSTATYFSKLYTEEALVPIAKLGAEVCEVFFASRCEYTEQFGRKINEELFRAQEYSPLKIHSIHALTNQFEPELFSVNDRAYSDALETFESVLKIGRQIGATHYTFHGATMLKKAVKYNFDYARISSRVDKLIDMAASYGIDFCYENVHWTYFSTPKYFEKLKELCPRLSCTLDIKQAMQSGIDYVEYLDVMQDRLATVHLCDYKNDGSLAIPGRGDFDFVTFFKRLKDRGYDGVCLMELYAKDYKDDIDIKEAYDYLLDCLDRANNI